MSATASALRINQRTWRARTPAYAIIALLGSAGAYFLAVKFAKYSHFNAAAYGRFWNVRWWLVAHIAASSLALVLGPLQFSSALRRRRLRLHRAIGRIYLGGIAAGGLSALYMAFFHASKAFGISLAALAVAWMTCSAMALAAIRLGNVPQHREWMIRSYVLTYAFVTFRMLMTLPMIRALGKEASPTAGWLCWSIPLLATEVALQSGKLRTLKNRRRAS